MNVAHAFAQYVRDGLGFIVQVEGGKAPSKLKTIAQEWQGFAAMIFAKMTPAANQVEETRKAFFAGAWAMLNAMRVIPEVNTTPRPGEIEWTEPFDPSKSRTPRTDAIITQAMKPVEPAIAALQEEAESLEARPENPVSTLSKLLTTQAEGHLMTKIIEAFEGVKKLGNEITNDEDARCNQIPLTISESINKLFNAARETYAESFMVNFIMRAQMLEGSPIAAETQAT